MFKRLFPFSRQTNSRKDRLLAKQMKKTALLPRYTLGKRQKFIIAVTFLSASLLISEYVFTTYNFFVSLGIAFLTDVLLLWALWKDLRDDFSPQVFILPFLFSLAFGQFYFLAPQRQLTRFVVTTLYAVGMYSLFLSQNIFLVASIRTIQLLNGARIVSFVITLISYFFLSNILFSLRISVFFTAGIFFIITFLSVMQSLWTYTLEKSLKKNIWWTIIISLALVEMAVMIWFWPSTPTILAIFLTGLFYMVIGLSHVWFDKRLFKGVLWEYIWVMIFAFFILIWFTQWQ